jgi:hypothetical protein
MIMGGSYERETSEVRGAVWAAVERVRGCLGRGGAGQGLRGPEKAPLSAVQAAAAVMPPLDWARPVTPEAEAEGFAGEDAPGEEDAAKDGLAGEEGGEVDATTGVAPACGVFGTRPVKLEPRIRSTVPGVRLATFSEVTLVSSFLRVFTAAMSAAEAYSMTEVV